MRRAIFAAAGFPAPACACLFAFAAALLLFTLPAHAQCPGLEASLRGIEEARSVEESAPSRMEAARCYLENARYLELWRVLAPLVESTSRAREWSEATQFLGEALLTRGLYLRAAEAFLSVTTQAEEDGARRRANESLRSLLPALEPQERRYLLWCFPGAAALCEARAEVTGAALDAGDYDEVMRVGKLAGCSNEAAETISTALSQVSAKIAAEAGDDFYSIGVLAPLSGDLARYGEALSQGITLAIEEHNALSSIRLRMRVADTSSDAVRAAAVAESLATLGVGAVIGPILSSSTLVAAAVLRPSGTVLLSPAAVDERVGLVGAHVFQTVVPRRLQGRALAEYAVKKRGWKRIASIAPETEDGRALAGAFVERARELGADIVAEEDYRPGQAAFGDVIRQAVSGQAEVLFAGGEVDDLVGLVTQLDRRGPGIALLGPESIGQPKVLAALAGMSTEAAYAEDYYLLPQAHEEIFIEHYKERYGMPPDRFARHGYVAASLLAQAYEQGAWSRRSLRERLSERLGGDPYLRERRILEPDPRVATVAVYRVDRGEVTRAEP